MENNFGDIDAGEMNGPWGHLLTNWFLGGYIGKKLVTKLAQDYGEKSMQQDSPVRRAQVEQYMYPEKDILPRTNLRPTALNNADTTQVWRSIKSFLPDTIHGMGMFKDKDLPATMPTTFLPNLGLGRYRASVGKDSSGYYISTYDNWDFKSDDKSEEFDNNIGIQIMNRSGGKGFNVYDRFYFTPDTVKTGMHEGQLQIPRRISTR